MMAKVKFNKATGEAVMFDGSSWVPTKVATNKDTGESVAFDGTEWVSVDQSISWSDVPDMAMDNFGSSAKQFGSDIVQPFISPIETAKSLGNLGLGIIQKVIPGEQESEKYADAVGKFFADRYGGEEELKRTMATDPVGFLADASTVLTGGGALAAKLPGTVGRVGKTVGTVGKVIDPVNLAVKPVGGVLKGVNNPAASRLMDQGVTPTAGQILGGGFKKAEDAVMSVPVIGSAIGGARQRANTQLNTAAYNRALNPIGKNAKGIEVGASGIADVSDELSAAYKRLLPQVSLPVDTQLLDDITSAVDGAKRVMDEGVSNTLDKIVDGTIRERLQRGNLTGEELKILQEDIAGISGNLKAGTASERTAGNALESIQSSLRQALARANPNFASELKAIDTGYANYARIRNAGGAAGADIGGFTPAQLRAGVKSADKSPGKGDTARGRALMQDLSMDAREVMGNNLPTSGTVERGILASLLLGGAYFDPLSAAGVAAGSLPYLPGSQRAMAHALISRPDAARAAGNAVSQYGPTVGRASFQAGRTKEEIQRQNMIDAMQGAN
jgi:hypothetical protein